MHTGSPTSPHNNVVESMSALMNVSGHIDKVMNAQTLEEVKKNRLRHTATIESIHWLCLQGCALRGNDGSSYSKNQDIQKENLHILAERVRKKIREDVGSAKFCLLIDEAKDISDKDHMAIVLRFVDREAFLMERFFDIVHVSDTTAVTLKKEICNVLGRHDLHINIRDQGYDGASNMCGSWNGLQALFLMDSPQSYYVHCFAHRLQLALVAAAEKESSIWLFFSKLNFICNLIKASPKRHIELQFAQAIEIATMVATGIREKDFQVEKLNSRFNDEAVEILRLSSALEPRDNFKLFNADDIYNFAEKFYPSYFNKQELHYLKKTEKARHYHLIDILIRLVLTLLVYTATTKRSFSTMKLLKTSLWNKVEENLLEDSMIVYIEREFTARIDIDSIIDKFYSTKNNWAHLR
ncbi:uncharacterized protein LOC142521291 [Primulina tabacum]|uniref:uncharacterized protein LOC142521291 n=1 Tax=Primulina tabacum TaxID=48773 RepID=UPI003F5A3F77